MRFWILLFTTFLSGSQSFALEDDLLKRNIEEGARQLEQLIEQNRKAAANKQVYIIDFAGANATGQGYSDETPNGRLKLGEKEYAVKQWSENARTAVTAEIARLNADPAMEGSKIYVGVNLNHGSIYTSKEIIDYDPVSGVNVLSKQHKTTGVSQKYEELKTIVQGIANQVGGKYVFVAYGYFVGQGLTSEKGSTKLYSLVGHVSSQQLTVQPNLPVIFDKLRTIPSDQIGPKLIPYMRGISDAISGIDYNLKNSFNVLQSKYLEKLQKFPKDTAVSQNEYTLAVRITHDASSPAAIKQVKDAVDHIQAKQIILWLDYRTSKYEFFYGSGVGSDKRVDALENLVRYLPEPAFWGLPNDFNPLLSLLSGIAGAIGELQIPPRFYDPDQSNYDPFFDVILLTGTKLFGTATDSDFFRDIAASTGKYTITRMDVAFNCGFWNGLVDQIKGIPESGAYLVKFFTDGATRKELKDGLKKFRQTAQEKGGYWNSITSMAVQQYEHANPCVRSAGFGTATANLLTIPLAFVKTGALSKLSTLMDALDPFSLLFKPVAAFSKFAIKQGGNVVAGAYKLGAGAVTATLENGAVVLKMVGKVGEALKNIDWKIARVVVLEGTDGRLVPMLVLTGSDPLTSALQKVKEVVETTGKNASGVDENRLLRTADGSELRVLEQANGNEIVGIVKQLDWLMAYPKLLERLKTLDGDALARFAGDFEGNAAMLARFEGNPRLVDAWKRLGDLGRNQMRKDPGILEAMRKSMDIKDIPANRLDKIINSLAESGARCKTCDNVGTDGLRYIDEVLEDLSAFAKEFKNVTGYDDFLREMGEQATKATGGSWTLEALMRNRSKYFNGETITGFEVKHVPGRDFAADVRAQAGDLTIFKEFKSWSSNLLGQSNMIDQMVGTMSVINNLDEMKFIFNPSRWVPTASQLKTALQSKASLLDELMSS